MANFLTLIRIPLLIGFLAMLYYGTPLVQLLSVPFLLFAILLDTADGIVARRQNSATLVGGVLDMATDRLYELVLWVALADLRTIPVAVPVIVIIRTTLTDAFRSIGVRKGLAPFEQPRSRLATFIVSSGWMRSGYSVAKIFAFCILTAGLAISQFPIGSAAQGASGSVLGVGNVLAWIAVVICIVRGVPVIGSGLRQLREAPASKPDPTHESRDTQLAH